MIRLKKTGIPRAGKLFILNLVVLLLTAFFLTRNAYACDTSRAFTSGVTLLGGTFSAGQDFSTGTIVRKQRVSSPTSINAGCVGSTSLLFTISGGSLYPGSTNIYQTGIEGLGVRFRSVRGGVIFQDGASTGFGGTLSPPSFSFDIEFVMMGSITGGTVNTSAFPTLIFKVKDGYGNIYTLATYNISGGSINVQVPTCTTPNYNYNLGTYGLSNFSGGTQVSPWMDTPITLTGCATFYGNNSNGSFTDTDQRGQSPASRGTIAPNTLTVTLKSNTSIIDSKNGIVSLDSTSTATGVAIQVGNGQSGLYTPLDLNSGIILTTTPGLATTSYTFPVGARIVRSTGDLAPGSVSSSFVYTVTYK